MIETPCRDKLRFEDLPCRARELINAIHEHHKQNKRGDKLWNNDAVGETHVETMRPKYAELTEIMRDYSPGFATHFKLLQTGDVIFITSQNKYGQTFKRLWNLHLPLC
ncbi:MAG: hypothetical protein V1931_04710 [Candidatus Micrarchaeota archaeon]